MNTRKVSIMLASLAILAALLACNLIPALPTVTNIRMTTDNTGSTTTFTYAPGDAFFVFADLKGLSNGSIVEAKWYAVNAQGVDPNTLINTSDYSYQPTIGSVYFQLTNSDGSDWPIGFYKVELYLDGASVGAQDFTVK